MHALVVVGPISLQAESHDDIQNKFMGSIIYTTQLTGSSRNEKHSRVDIIADNQY